VAHQVGSNLLRDMGGLRRTAPALAVALAVGLAALAGLPPLTGFVSKEAVLTSVEDVALHGGGALDQQVSGALLVAGYVTTLLTGLYAARAAAIVLLGPAQVASPARLPRVMELPVLVLAGLTVLGGLLLAPFGPAVLADASLGVLAALVGTALALAGAAVGLLAAGRPDRDVAALLPARFAAVLHDGYRLDAVQDALVVRPVRRLARVVAAGDDQVVDAYVRGAALGSTATGGALRRVQNGSVTGQLGWVLAGSAAVGLLALAVVLR